MAATKDTIHPPPGIAPGNANSRRRKLHNRLRPGFRGAHMLQAHGVRSKARRQESVGLKLLDPVAGSPGRRPDFPEVFSALGMKRSSVRLSRWFAEARATVPCDRDLCPTRAAEAPRFFGFHHLLRGRMAFADSSALNARS